MSQILCNIIAVVFGLKFKDQSALPNDSLHVWPFHFLHTSIMLIYFFTISF